MLNEPPSETKMDFINAPNSNFSDLEGDLVSSDQTKTANTTNNNSTAFTTINLNPLLGIPTPSSSSPQIPYISTLDEPVSVTINRDKVLRCLKNGK